MLKCLKHKKYVTWLVETQLTLAQGTYLATDANCSPLNSPVTITISQNSMFLSSPEGGSAEFTFENVMGYVGEPTLSIFHMRSN